MRWLAFYSALMMILVGLPIAAMACGDGGPAPLMRVFQVDMRPERRFAQISDFEVNQGDEVIFNIRSRRKITIVVREFGISAGASDDKTNTVSFLADRAGRFPVVMEETGETVAYLVVSPMGSP